MRQDPVLLEPIMKVEVVTPEDYMGDVVGDLNRRRGSDFEGMDENPAGKVVRALTCRCAEMFGYSTDSTIVDARAGRLTRWKFRSITRCRITVPPASSDRGPRLHQTSKHIPPATFRIYR